MQYNYNGNAAQYNNLYVKLGKLWKYKINI